VYALAFAPDGRTLVAGTREGTLVTWDVERQQITATLRQHSGRVLALAFSGDGSLLASGGTDERIVIWDWATRRPLGEPLSANKGDVQFLTFVGPDLLAAYSRSTVLAWRIDVRDWERNACHAAGRDLLPAERERFLASSIRRLRVCP
jgi:WD40 repeat protein